MAREGWKQECQRQIHQARQWQGAVRRLVVLRELTGKQAGSPLAIFASRAPSAWEIPGGGGRHFPRVAYASPATRDHRVPLLSTNRRTRRFDGQYSSAGPADRSTGSRRDRQAAEQGGATGLRGGWARRTTNQECAARARARAPAAP